MKTDIFQTITDEIIKSLEAGVKPWICPWDDSGCSCMPCNFLSQQYYHGANVLVLWMASHKKGFHNHQWITFKQAQAAGGHIKKGEHGTQGFYFNFVEKEDATDSTKTVMVPFVKPFTLFNLEQTEGILNDTDTDTDTESVKINPVQRADEVVKKSGAIIKYYGGSAYYSPTTDMITMPEKNRFTDTGDYYCTLLHELTHWTGHKNRLNREGITEKKDKERYAFEELVAEIGSCFLCQTLDIKGELQHENYLDYWIKQMKGDKRFIIKAASLAGKAHEFLMPEYAYKEKEENNSPLAKAA